METIQQQIVEMQKEIKRLREELDHVKIGLGKDSLIESLAERGVFWIATTRRELSQEPHQKVEHRLFG